MSWPMSKSDTTASAAFTAGGEGRPMMPGDKEMSKFVQADAETHVLLDAMATVQVGQREDGMHKARLLGDQPHIRERSGATTFL